MIKNTWNELVETRGKYKKLIFSLYHSSFLHLARSFVTQIKLISEDFYGEVDALRAKTSTRRDPEQKYDVVDFHGLQKIRNDWILQSELKLSEMQYYTNIVQDMLDWVPSLILKTEMRLAKKDALDDVLSRKSLSVNKLAEIRSILDWKKHFWSHDIQSWIHLQERIVEVKPFSDDADIESIQEVIDMIKDNFIVLKGHLGERLAWADSKGIMEEEECSFMNDITASIHAWVRTLDIYTDVLNKPHQSSSVQMRHLLTLEMKRKGRSLIDCTLLDIHDRSIHSPSMQNREAEDVNDYGKALFELFNVERQLRCTHFVITSVSPDTGTGVNLITNLSELFTVVEKVEDIVGSVELHANNMDKSKADNEFAKEIELNDELERIKGIIEGARYTVEMLQQSQCYYLLFSRLSNSPSFLKYGPVTAVRRFVDVERIWLDKIITPLRDRSTGKQQSILSASSEAPLMLRNRHNVASALLEQCHDIYDGIIAGQHFSALQSQYSRLYFIPNSVLVHSIAYENEPRKMLKDFYRSCFMGVAEVVTSESDRIVETSKDHVAEIQEKSISEIVGMNGETVKLYEPVMYAYLDEEKLRRKGENSDKAEKLIKVEHLDEWAAKLEGAIKDTLRREVQRCLNEVQSVGFTEWILKSPLQCILVVNEILWVRQVERGVVTESGIGGGGGGGRGRPNALTKFYQQICLKNSKFVEILKGLYKVERIHKESRIKVKKTESLLCTALIHRDIVEDLIANQLTSISDFDWQKYIRYYWNDDEISCHVCCGIRLKKDDGIEYGFEYRGDDKAGDLLIDGLTFQSKAMLSAAHASFGSALVTPIFQCFGTDFKKEVVEGLARVTGQYHVSRDAATLSCDPKSLQQSWLDFLTACNESKTWVFIEHVDYQDISLLSRLVCILDEMRERIAVSQMLATNGVESNAARFFFGTDTNYHMYHKNDNTPFTRVSRKIFLSDWSFKTVFETVLMMKLTQNGSTLEDNICHDLAITVATILKVMHGDLSAALTQLSPIMMGQHIVQAIRQDPLITIENCSYVVLNALQAAFGQYLSEEKNQEMDDMYKECISSSPLFQIKSEKHLEKQLDELNLRTAFESKLDRFVYKNLQHFCRYEVEVLAEKSIQAYDALKDNTKTVVLLGSSGSGKSAVRKMLLHAFEDFKSEKMEIYCGTDLESITFLTMDKVLRTASDSRRIKSMNVSIKMKSQAEVVVPNPGDLVILDGRLSHKAMTYVVKSTSMARIEGQEDLPVFVLESPSLRDASPGSLYNLHVVYCGPESMISVENYLKYSMDMLEERFKHSVLVPSISQFKIHVERVELIEVLAKYFVQYKVQNRQETDMVSDLLQTLRIFFDMLSSKLEKLLKHVLGYHPTPEPGTLHAQDLAILGAVSMAWAVSSRLFLLDYNDVSQSISMHVLEPLWNEIMSQQDEEGAMREEQDQKEAGEEKEREEGEGKVEQGDQGEEVGEDEGPRCKFELDSTLMYEVYFAEKAPWVAVAHIKSELEIAKGGKEHFNLSQSTFLTRAMMHKKSVLMQWITDFGYDVHILGSSCSGKTTLMKGVVNDLGTACNPILPSSVYTTILSSSMHSSSNSNGDGPLGQDVVQGTALGKGRKVLIIEDLHISSKSDPTSNLREECMRKHMDTDKHGFGLRRKTMQFVCSGSLKHYGAIDKEEDYVGRLLHHLCTFPLQHMEEGQIIGLFMGRLHGQVVRSYGFQGKPLGSLVDLLIASTALSKALVSSVVKMLKGVDIGVDNGHGVKGNYVSLGDFSHYADAVFVDFVQSLGSEKKSILASMHGALKSNLPYLTLSMMKARGLCSEIDTIFYGVNGGIAEGGDDGGVTSSLPSSHGDLEEAWSKFTAVVAENKAKFQYDTPRRALASPEDVQEMLASFCKHQLWDVGVSKGVEKTKYDLEIKFWSALSIIDGQKIWKQMEWIYSKGGFGALTIQNCEDVLLLNRYLPWTEVVAWWFAREHGAKFVSLSSDSPLAIGQKLIDIAKPKCNMVIFADYKTMKTTDFLKTIEEQVFERRNAVFKSGETRGHVLLVLDCKDINDLQQDFKKSLPHLLHYTHSCALYNDDDEWKDHMRQCIRKMFGEFLAELSADLDKIPLVTSGTMNVYSDALFEVFTATVDWVDDHFLGNMRVRKAELWKSKGSKLTSYLFDHMYLTAWLILHSFNGNDEARKIVDGQLKAYDDLMQAYRICMTKTGNIQGELEDTLNKGSAILLEIAQKKQNIETTEFKFSVDDYKLRYQHDRLVKSQKHIQGNINHARQSFSKAKEAIMAVPEMEMEEVRSNVKPPKLILRLAKACALVLAIGNANTAHETAEIEMMDWTKLNTKLFSRTRVYHKTGDSRISFFKREVDEYNLDFVFKKVSEDWQEVEVAMGELDALLVLPDFKLGRVEQVSKALKPLCAWILSVHEFLKSMLELDRVVVELGEREQQLKYFENLGSIEEQQQIKKLSNDLKRSQQNYEANCAERDKLETKKENLEVFEHTSEALLESTMPWIEHCKRAQDAFEIDAETFSHRVMAASSITVYGASYHERLREELKGAWKHAFCKKDGEDSLMVKVLSDFELHRFLKESFTHEWFLDKDRTIPDILDTANRNMCYFNSKSHLSESVAIAWLCSEALQESCVYVDPEAIGTTLIKRWQKSNETLGEQTKIRFKLIDSTHKEAVDAKLARRMTDLVSVRNESAASDQPLLYAFVRSTCNFANPTSHRNLKAFFGDAHLIDLTIDDASTVEYYIHTSIKAILMSNTTNEDMGGGKKSPFKEMESKLMTLGLQLDRTKSTICKKLTSEGFSQYLNCIDDEFFIDTDTLATLRSDFNVDLVGYVELVAQWIEQLSSTSNFLKDLPENTTRFVTMLSHVFAANNVNRDYLHTQPLTQFLKTLELLVIEKFKSRRIKGKKILQNMSALILLDGEAMQQEIMQEIFDLLVTHRYVESHWIHKATELVFKYELLRSAEFGVVPMVKEEWTFFIKWYLDSRQTSGNEENKVSKLKTIGLLIQDKGKQSYSERLFQIAEAIQTDYPCPGAFEQVHTILTALNIKNSKYSIEKTLAILDEYVDKKKGICYWRFSLLLFIAALTPRHEELAVQWSVKHALMVDTNVYQPSQASNVASLVERLDNRIPMLLAVPKGDHLQTLRQAALRSTMNFARVDKKKLAAGKAWQSVVLRATSKKQFHTYKVEHVSIFDLYGVNKIDLTSLMIHRINDGVWFAVLDVDMEDRTHVQICQTLVHIILKQRFVETPKDFFKMIICADMSKNTKSYFDPMFAGIHERHDLGLHIDLSFFTCNCLPYITSNVMWQQGEIVGIHEGSSAVSPSLLAPEMLDLFEVYQEYKGRVAQKYNEIRDDALILDKKNIGGKEEDFFSKQSSLLTAEDEEGAAWRCYAIVIGLIHCVVVARQKVGIGLPSQHLILPSYFEVLASIEFVHTWLQHGVLHGQNPQELDGRFTDRLTRSNVQDSIRHIVGTIYGPVYGCSTLLTKSIKHSEDSLSYEGYFLLLWSSMYDRFFSYDILNKNFIKKLNTVGSTLSVPGQKVFGKKNWHTEMRSITYYPIRPMALAGDLLAGIEDLVDAVLALPSNSLASIADLASVTEGQVLYFQSLIKMSMSLSTMSPILIHVIIPAIQKDESKNRRIINLVTGLQTELKSVRALLVKSYGCSNDAVPNTSKMRIMLLQYFEDEVESCIFMINRALDDLALIEGTYHAIQAGKIDEMGAYTIYLVSCILMNSIPSMWKVSSSRSYVITDRYTFHDMGMWRMRVKEIAQSLDRIIKEVILGKTLLRIDLRNVIDHRCFFDSMRKASLHQLGEHTEGMDMKFTLMTEKIAYLIEETEYKISPQDDVERIIIEGMSVVEAVWHEQTFHLQDLRSPVEHSAFVKPRYSRQEHMKSFTSLLPPMILKLSSLPGSPIRSITRAAGDVKATMVPARGGMKSVFASKEVFPSSIFVHSSITDETEYCDIPVMDFSAGHRDQFETFIATLRLPSRRSTSYWVKRGSVAYVNRYQDKVNLH